MLLESVSGEAVIRARWYQNSEETWILKCTLRDGGHVLASVKKERSAYTWSIVGKSDWHPGRRGAMMAARYEVYVRSAPIR